MNRMPRVRIPSIQKHPDAQGLEVIHLDSVGGSSDAAQVVSTYQQVDILRCPHSRRISRRNPNRHGLSADECIGHMG
jgi:hypothetical protein